MPENYCMLGSSNGLFCVETEEFLAFKTTYTLCILYEIRNMPGNLNAYYKEEVGLFHYGFLKYRNEIHKEAWFRKMNCFISATMFIFIV